MEKHDPVDSSSLRDRCRAFYQKQSRDAVLRQNDPVEELVKFVESEKARWLGPGRPVPPHGSGPS
jgi:hypothetical protein